MSTKSNKLASIVRDVRNGHRRWGILLMLFFVTVIMFIDRQSLSVLAPTIMSQLHISSAEYSYVVMVFMIATGAIQLPLGPLLDRIGVRVGLAMSLMIWATGAALQSLTTGALSLGLFRIILGIGEAGDVPSSSKAVAEWFPAEERGFAMGFFTGGTAIGALLAPPIIALLATNFGWRSAFLATPILSVIWLIVWFRTYRTPQAHPKLTEEERALIANRGKVETVPTQKRSIAALVRNKRFWGIVIVRTVTAPISAFGYYWLPLFLSQRFHWSLVEIGAVAWIPFLAQDLGSIGGGVFSGFLIRGGRSPARARLIVLGIGAVLMSALVPSAWVGAAWLAVLLISTTTFALGSFSANIFALASDQFDSSEVATVVSWSQVTLFAAGATFAYFLGQVAGVAYVHTFLAASGLALVGFAILMVLNWGQAPAPENPATLPSSA